MTWPTPFKPASSPSACGQSPHWPGVGWIRIGRPIASTTACNLVVRPPRDRPMAAASAPLLRPSRQRGPSRWCCRSARIRSPAYRPGRGTTPPIRQHATSGETVRAPRSTCQTHPAGHASAQRCQPSIRWRPRRADCRRRCDPECQPDQGDTLQSVSIARLSACVCSRPGSSPNLESEAADQWNPLNADSA